MSIISYAQNFEDVMLWRALSHIERGFYIDIGAQDPVIDSVSLAFHEHGWHGIHVEPTPHYAELLRQQRPGDKVIQTAIGNGPLVLQFFVIDDTGISTGDPTIASQHRERGFDVRETTVPCIPLSAILETCADVEIHWLKIDVEGFEQQVLSSWGASTVRPWIVVVESTLPLTQIETHKTWEGILLAYSYTPVYFDGLNRYYVSDAHPELRDSFRVPPNVFDGFSLNGTASAAFHQLIVNRYQEKINTILSQAEQKNEFNNIETEVLSQRIVLLNKIHAESEVRWNKTEQELIRELKKISSDLASSLNLQVQREIETVARLQLIEQNAAQEKVKQANLFSDEKRNLELQYFKTEQDFYILLEAEQQNLRCLKEERLQTYNEYMQRSQQFQQTLEDMLNKQLFNEREHRKELLLVQKKELRRNSAHAFQYREQARILHSQYAVREQAQAETNSKTQTTFENFLQSQRAVCEQEFSQKINILTSDLDLIKHTHKLQIELKDVELSSKLTEHKRLIDVCSTLTAQLKTKTEVERENNIHLHIALAEIEKALIKIYESFTWRIKVSLCRAVLFINPKNKIISVSSLLITASEEIKMVAEGSSLVNSKKNISEMFVQASTENISRSFEPDENKTPVQSRASMPNYLETSQFTTQQAFTLPTMHHFTQSPNHDISNPISTLSELLGYQDQNFIHYAYQVLLGRLPDPEGMKYYLSRLRNGFSKLKIIEQLRFSKEGKVQTSNLPGLAAALKKHHNGQYPLIGWLFRYINGVESNNFTARKLRSIENNIFIIHQESNSRFDQLELSLASLHASILKQNEYSLALFKEVPVPTNDGLPNVKVSDIPNDISQSVKDIYIKLKTAINNNVGK